MVSDSLEKVLAGQASSFSWRMLTEGAAVSTERASRLHRGSTGPRLQLASAGAGRRSDDPASGRADRRKVPGERAADRAGRDQRRAIWGDQGECGPQRRGHGRYRGFHSLARSAVGASHPGAGRQSRRRAGRDGGAGIVDDRRLQRYLDLFHGAVRRHRRRLRHSVQRPLSRRTASPRRLADGHPQRRIESGLAARPRLARDRSGILLVSSDRLQGRIRTRSDRRSGNADRLRQQCDPASRTDQARQSPGRAGSPGLRFSRAGRRLSGQAQGSNHRRHAARRRLRVACALSGSGSTSIRSICRIRRARRSRPISSFRRIARRRQRRPGAGPLARSGRTPSANRLGTLPEVESVRTLSTFIPCRSGPENRDHPQRRDEAGGSVRRKGSLRRRRPTRKMSDALERSRAAPDGSGRRTAGRGRDRREKAGRSAFEARACRPGDPRQGPGDADLAAERRPCRSSSLARGGDGDAGRSAAARSWTTGLRRTAGPVSRSCRRRIRTTLRRCGPSHGQFWPSNRMRRRGRSRR